MAFRMASAFCVPGSLALANCAVGQLSGVGATGAAVNGGAVGVFDCGAVAGGAVGVLDCGAVGVSDCGTVARAGGVCAGTGDCAAVPPVWVKAEAASSRIRNKDAPFRMGMTILRRRAVFAHVAAVARPDGTLNQRRRRDSGQPSVTRAPDRAAFARAGGGSAGSNVPWRFSPRKGRYPKPVRAEPRSGGARSCSESVITSQRDLHPCASPVRRLLLSCGAEAVVSPPPALRVRASMVFENLPS